MRRSCASAVLEVVILSVRLSVPRVLCDKTKQRTVDILIRKGNHSSFLTPTLVGGWRPLRSEICAQSDPTPFENRRLWQISAYNVSTARDSKKVKLQWIGSPLRAFQRAIDGVHTLPLSPSKVSQKAIFYFCFLNKIQFKSNKVCHKVSLCENFQRQVVILAW